VAGGRGYRAGIPAGDWRTLTFKNSGVAALGQEIPLEHLVLETDAPFLAPEPHRGQRNEPAYTRLVWNAPKNRIQCLSGCCTPISSTMKRTRHTSEQIITHLRKVEAMTAQGATIAEAVKKLGFTEQTFYRWKKQFGGMDRDQVKRLKELEQENARLKRLLADKDLDIDILKEVIAGKY